MNKNELSLSLNTVLFHAMGGPLLPNISLYYTHRIDDHWAWRTGLGLRKTADTYWGTGPDLDPVSDYVTKNKFYFFKAGILRYTRGKIVKAYYGLDLGYQYHTRYLTQTTQENDTTSHTAFPQLFQQWKWQEYTNEIVLSPVIGARADFSRHFALAAEFSPEVFFGRVKRYSSFRNESGSTQAQSPVSFSRTDTNRVPLLTRLNLVYKF